PGPSRTAVQRATGRAATAPRGGAGRRKTLCPRAREDVAGDADRARARAARTPPKCSCDGTAPGVLCRCREAEGAGARLAAVSSLHAQRRPAAAWCVDDE